MAKTVTGLPYCQRCGGVPVIQWSEDLRKFRVKCRWCTCKTIAYTKIEDAEAEWSRIATEDGE